MIRPRSIGAVALAAVATSSVPASVVHPTPAPLEVSAFTPARRLEGGAFVRNGFVSVVAQMVTR